ncbi:hypothetical protein NDU88_009630 [Pleurodeles waltl]|uniref:Uncharacterized protein n=1 Tax=Pleurodeles waltl TaxID=8319 RepID=A0AAV7PSN0_PLEWA|nr:hypothetical protein NDU88_009630 [Pleurodeles waltl]
MSPWRAGLISTHQLNSVGPPGSLYQCRSACTAPSKTTPGPSSQPPSGAMVLSFRPNAELPARPSKISGTGVYNPEVREPDPRRPPGPAPPQSHSRAPGSRSSAGHRQSSRAPGTPFTTQAPQASGARPHSSLRSSGGPKRAPRPSNPGAPELRGPNGKARPAAQAAPHAAAAPCLLGRASLLPSTQHNLAQPGQPRPGHPGRAAHNGESLQASPRLATGRFFGPRRRSAKRNVLALRHLDHTPSDISL